MNNKPTILFFTPYLGRNGAEIALLNFLGVLVAENKYKIALVSGYEGDIAPMVPAEVRLYCLNEIQQELMWKVDNKLKKGDIWRRIITKINKKLKPVFWFINASVQPKFLQLAIEWKIPVLQYSHELKARLDEMDASYLHDLTHYPILNLVSSTHCSEDIINLGCTNVQVLHPPIDFSKISINISSEELRNTLGLKPSDKMIALAGNLDDNKNPELFLAVAKYMSTIGNFKFYWLGGDLEKPYAQKIISLANEMQLAGIVNFMGWQKQLYYSFLAASDVVLCTSKHESFGMSLVEAVYLSKPVVSTPCGGPSETINSELGIVTSDFEVTTISSAIIKALTMNPKNGNEKVKQFGIDYLGTQFCQVITNTLAELK